LEIGLDTTPPTFADLAASPAQAQEGSVVTLTFSASEALATSPTVTVNGHAAEFINLTGLTWTYSYTVGADDPDGAAVIRIAGQDQVGNPGEIENNTALWIGEDTQPPTFTSLLAVPSVAREGSAVTLTFSASEALAASPVVTVNGHGALLVGLTGTVWTYSYIVGADDAEGVATILVSGLDLAGNPGQMSNNTALAVDKTAPVFSDLQAVPAVAGPGAQVSLFFLVSETLGATPVVTVNGNPAQYVQASGQSYEFRYEILAADAEGAATVAIVGADVAGNTGQTESLTALWIDKTGPTVALLSTAPDPVQTTSMTVTALFSEPVSGFDAGDVEVTNAVLGAFAADATGTSYTFVLDMSASAQGLVTVSVGAGVAQDASGNANQAAAPFSRFYDFTSAPMLEATLGLHTYRIALTWNEVTSATHYRVYRALSAEGEKVAVSPWLTRTWFDDCDAALQPETDYTYWVQAARSVSGELPSDFSAPAVGRLGADPDLASGAAALKQFRIQFSPDCVMTNTLDAEATSGALTFQTSSPKAWVKIKRLPKFSDLPDNPAKRTYYLKAVSLPRVVVQGDLNIFQTDAHLHELQVAGTLKSLTANAPVELLNAAALGTVKITARKKADLALPTYAWTSLLSGQGTLPLKVQIKGAILENLITDQGASYVKVYSYKHKDPATKLLHLSLGGVGTVRHVEAEALGLVSPLLPGDSVLKATGGVSLVSVSGGPMAPYAVETGVQKMLVSGVAFKTSKGTVAPLANLAVRRVVSNTPIALLSAKAANVKGQGLKGGVIGFAANPSAMRVCAPSFTQIIGSGIAGVFVAGFEGDGEATYQGAIKKITTQPAIKGGFLKGEAHVAAPGTIKFKPAPMPDTFAVYTSSPAPVQAGE
jgi:hypothetical protein